LTIENEREEKRSKKIGNLNVAAGYRCVVACNGLRVKGKEKGGQERIRSVYGVTL
jgi:hypothetical protein